MFMVLCLHAGPDSETTPEQEFSTIQPGVVTLMFAYVCAGRDGTLALALARRHSARSLGMQSNSAILTPES